MAPKRRKTGIHDQLAAVIKKHGEKSPVVKAIEAAIIVLLGASLSLSMFVAQAAADCWWWDGAMRDVYAQERVLGSIQTIP